MEIDEINITSKKEVFEYLKRYSTKQNPIVRESKFSKIFHVLYLDFKLVSFKEELPFRQLLWHFLQNDENLLFGKCPICGNRCKFDSFSTGYSTYCSKECDLKDRKNIYIKSTITKEQRYGDKNYNNPQKNFETNMKLYGVRNSSQRKEVRDKMTETRRRNNGGLYETKEQTQKRKDTCLRRFGCESNAQSDISKKKQMETCLKKYGNKSFLHSDKFKQIMEEKYGCENALQNNEIFNKRLNTLVDKKTFSTSKIEELFSEYLTKNNIDYIRQYKSDVYPFSCDFYLPKYDLYIEINGSWTHGKHPFDKNSKEDIEKLNVWKSKNGKYYDKAIDVWTNLDVRKIKTAKENNLNYLQIYSIKLEDCISALKCKLNEN